MKVLQSYNYDGSPDFTYDVELLESGVSLINTKRGPGGSDSFPYETAKVTVYSNVIGTSGQLDFRPTLNNKFYYLQSNDILTDRSEILSQATLITPVVLDSGRYKGEFVYSNPDDYAYLYLISDYTNNVPVTTTVTHTYAAGDQIVIDGDLESGQAGQVSFSYNASAGPFRVAIEYNGTIVADTGDLPGAASGTLAFVKLNTDDETARVIIDNPTVSNTIDITSDGTFLTRFYIDTANGTLSNVCSQIATVEMHHNGTGTLPVAGDIIYLDSAGNNTYDGGNSYHVFSPVVMVVPSTSSIFGAVVTSGSVTATGSCTCSEVAVPSITQTDITIEQDQELDVYVEVTNNPTSWTLVTTCNEYSLDGGVLGAVFNYTNCDSETKDTTVSRGGIEYVCASALPTVVTGSGIVTLVDVCQEGSLPPGLSFKDGFITGVPTTTGTYTIELIATNCFGDSANATFDVIVQSSVDLTPFAIDVEEPSDTGADACALTGVYTLLYHNGKANLPGLNDTIFLDYKAVERFVGGKMWYNVRGALYSIQVDEFGTVIDIHTC